MAEAQAETTEPLFAPTGSAAKGVLAGLAACLLTIPLAALGFPVALFLRLTMLNKVLGYEVSFYEESHGATAWIADVLVALATGAISAGIATILVMPQAPTRKRRRLTEGRAMQDQLKAVIRPCRDSGVEKMLAIVNRAAEAYRGAIPPIAGTSPTCRPARLVRQAARPGRNRLRLGRAFADPTFVTYVRTPGRSGSAARVSAPPKPEPGSRSGASPTGRCA